jgi:pimeloyl-ACP methyl ester carboxylesterase
VPPASELDHLDHLDIGNVELAALAWGPHDGKPVLASHGWLDNAASMSRLAPLLCASLGLRIVSLDLPGHGRSEHKRGPYHFIDSVADVIHAADALGWERFSLLGHSMGAGISTLVAGTIPERIERCVLLEGLGPLADEPAQAARRLGRSLRLEARKQHKAKRLFDHPDTAAARLLEVAKMDLESARILLARGLVEVSDPDQGWTWRADPGLRLDSRMRMSEEQVHAFLQAITCPVLMVSATEGWPHDEKLMRARIQSVANLEHVTIAGRHHVHLDDPEGVAELLIPFLRPLFEAANA